MMKSNRGAIVVMIMLGFVQILSVEAINTCPPKCALLCFVSDGPSYEDCYDQCIAKCNKMPAIAYNCITKCGVNKTVTVTIDDRGHVTDVVDSCLQNCPSLEE
ncbi:hypothetical protein VIGAN_06179400 [Vigna angularis var. angularis]|uniref:Acidic protein n=1 Tax=Vigna angularis var. angularis TaxID=157739 RepID=A0A0S3SCD4_PHAAN|nr:hypothetical protein VIGAN_06179400 [Vigna angularis var. angularis]